jgi:hypothetical protein
MKRLARENFWSKTDPIDRRYVIILVYLESNDIPKVPFSKRATAYLGIAPLRDILQAEIGGDQVQEMQETINWDAKPLVEGELESRISRPKTLGIM